MMDFLKRRCPACNTQSVGPAATIGAAVDSDSRCSNCGVALRFAARGKGVLTVSFFVALILGLISRSYWIGGMVFVVGLGSLYVFPLLIDKLDPMSLHLETRKKISSARPREKS